MAGRPRKNMEDIIAEKTENNLESSSELETLQKQIELLQQQNQLLQQQNQLLYKPIDEKEDVKENVENTKIPLDDLIEVISLRPEILNLSTDKRGDGKMYTFENFGEKKNILYEYLLQIMEAHPNFLKGGYYYIMDKRVVKRHGLGELYSQILSKEKIEGIINNNFENIVEVFASTNKDQQSVIINMIVDRAIAGQKIDLNIIDKMTRISEIDIQEIINERKTIIEEVMVNKK